MNRVIGFGLLAILVLFALEKTATTGFEVGNGRRVIKNPAGNYEIKIPSEFEVGLAGKYTEITTPLSAGTPRVRIQVNLVPENKLEDIIEATHPDWKTIQVGDLTGIEKKETVLPTLLHQVEARLQVPGKEVLLVNIEGAPSGLPNGAFEAAKRTLETIKVNQN